MLYALSLDVQFTFLHIVYTTFVKNLSLQISSVNKMPLFYKIWSWSLTGQSVILTGVGSWDPECHLRPF